MDRHKVRAGHELLKAHQLHTQRCRTGRVGIRIVRDDGGLKGRQALGKELADVAEAHDADGFAIDLDAFEGRALPLALAKRLIRRRHLARGGQEQGDGLLAGGVDVGGRRVDDHDSTLGGGWDVNVVQANASTADDLQVLCGGQNLRVHGRGGADEERIGLRHCGEKFLAVWAINPANLNGVTEGINSGFGKLIGDKYDRLRHNFLY